MRQRLLKHVRRLRWSIRLPGAVPLRWHVGRPNFGDDLNPLLWEAVLGRRVRLTSRASPHVLGMGSILERAGPRSLVAGSGFLCPPEPGTRISGQVLALRGRLSAACLPQPVLLGDPAVLAALLFPRPTGVRSRLGIVPHVTEVEALRAAIPRGVELIDVRAHPLEVVGRIASCERVLSQSLHGLIVAGAEGVPNAWLAPSSGMIGGRFKFDDYYSTTDRRPEPVSAALRELDSVAAAEFGVAAFALDLRGLIDGLRDGILSWSARA